MQSFEQVWQYVVAEASKNISATSASLWIRSIVPIDFKEDVVVLGVTSPLHKQVIENKYRDIFADLIEEVLGFRMDIELTIIDQPEETSAPVVEPDNFDRSDITQYTFENFLVGSSNKLAHAACAAVASDPGNIYNPLLIYGQSGLGKTHLLYAIKNQILSANPNANVAYLKSEDFTNELILSINHGTTEQFRRKYRYVDALLVDDIQFIAGKESTQEEFFHTFNSLYDVKKQIILTSDRPPRDLSTLEDRLRTRFEWGLIVDIQPPDTELRMALIRNKAREIGIEIPYEAVEYIASRIKSNIRQLEGAVKKLKAICLLEGQSPTLQLAQEAIRDISRGSDTALVTVDKIIAEVARYYSLSPDDLRGRRRTSEVAFARHVAMYLMRNMLEMSLPNVGTELGGRDHTTVMNGIDKVTERIKEDPSFSSTLDDLMKNIRGS